jgi:hypothetical protein
MVNSGWKDVSDRYREDDIWLKRFSVL